MARISRISQRTIYHLRQEVSQRAARVQAGADADELLELANREAYELARHYRTLRLETACRLNDLLFAEGQPAEQLLGVCVVAQLKRKFEASLARRVSDWAEKLDTDAFDRMFVEAFQQLATSLLRQCGDVRPEFESWVDSNLRNSSILARHALIATG